MTQGASPHRNVVFLGRRQGARAAAKALGLRVRTVRDGLASDAPRRSWARPFAAPSAVAALADEIASYGPVSAVLALTEGSVLPAAHLRVALGVPGQSIASAIACTDKVRMKETIRAADIPCAEFVSGEEGVVGDALVQRLGLPLVVKARASSGSRGTRVVREPAGVPGSLPPDSMAESFVGGWEMSVESLVVGGVPILENPTEYFRPGWANIVPAAIDPETWEQVRSVNRRAIAALGVERGMTHCEVFVTDAGVVFGELAVRPPGGHLMELIRRAYDFDPWEALLRIALGETPELPASAARHAGVWLLHPGRGVIESVSGVEEARALPGVVDLPFRGEVGAEVGLRVGVGQELGHVTVVGRTRDDVARDLEAAHDAVKIRLVGSG